MTDTFTPGQLQDSDADTQSGSGSRKRLLIFGGMAAIIGLGAGLYFMFGMGSGSTDDSQFRLNTPVASAKPSSMATPEAGKPSAAASASAAKIGSRDPFKVLKPAAVAAQVAGVDTSASSGSTSSTTGDVSTTTTPAAGPATAPSPEPASTVTLAVSAVDPIAQTVVVDVDGKKYATGVGKTFAQGFSVYSVFNTQCVGILYGSKSTPVCMATPVTVTP
jgi:hypothetical protein